MVVVTQLLSSEQVRGFRESLGAAPWLDGAATAAGMASDVKHNAQADAGHPIVQELTNALLARLGEDPTFTSAALPHRIFPPCFNRYARGETYGNHVDAAIMRIPATPEVLRSDVSSTVFLSEPDDYEGGELVITTEFGEQSVKLPAGSAVIYPSASLHRVTPVTAGTRYAAITWIQSLVASAELRATLFRLDQAIQSLVDTGNADRAQLDNLHNVYHNLVRANAQL